MKSKTERIIDDIETESEYLNALRDEVNYLSKVNTKDFTHYKLNVWFEDIVQSSRGFDSLSFGIHFDKDDEDIDCDNLFDFKDEGQLRYFKGEAIKRDKEMIRLLIKSIHELTNQLNN